MNKAQKITLSIAFFAVLAVNLPYLIPHSYYYKGVQHGVGTPTVAVYVSDHDPSIPTVPVVNPGNNFSETGQRVSVYLRNDYQDGEIRFAPRLTLVLLLGFGILFAIITRITTRRSV